MTALTNAEHMKAKRARKAEAGLVLIRKWVPADKEAAVRAAIEEAVK